MKNQYYTRFGSTQYWSIKPTGEALLINLSVKGHHYNGDAHIFFNKGQYDKESIPKEKITKEQFDKVKEEYIERINTF